MGHPQYNFSSNMMGAETGDAKLNIKVNGVDHEYQPSGGDQEVAITEAVVFELGDGPTYAEVNEVVAAHISCYLHVSGGGVDYMAPYVGDATNAFRFETTDAPNKQLLGWLIRNGAGPLSYTSSYDITDTSKVIAAALNNLNARVESVETSQNNKNLGERTADSLDSQKLYEGGIRVKVRQAAKSLDGATNKTVTNISQDENGEFTATFDDIDFDSKLLAIYPASLNQMTPDEREALDAKITEVVYNGGIVVLWKQGYPSVLSWAGTHEYHFTWVDVYTDFECNKDILTYDTATKLFNLTSQDIRLGTYSVFNTTTDGLVPKANGTGDTGKYLKGNGTWDTPTDTTYSVFATNSNGLVPAPSVANNKFMRDDGTWQYPITGYMGDADHMSYITQDGDGCLYAHRGKRIHWAFDYANPSVTLTATDITNGFAEFIFVLGDEGLKIAETGNMICMKGYNIQTSNILNGKQLSFYIVNHADSSPRCLMDTGFQTYTESTVNNYDRKAFKAIGLTANKNNRKFDAVLRVPLSGTETAGDTFAIPGYVNICIFGVAGNDT